MSTDRARWLFVAFACVLAPSARAQGVRSRGELNAFPVGSNVRATFATTSSSYLPVAGRDGSSTSASYDAATKTFTFTGCSGASALTVTWAPEAGGVKGIGSNLRATYAGVVSTPLVETAVHQTVETSTSIFCSAGTSTSSLERVSGGVPISCDTSKLASDGVAKCDFCTHCSTVSGYRTPEYALSMWVGVVGHVLVAEFAHFVGPGQTNRAARA